MIFYEIIKKLVFKDIGDSGNIDWLLNRNSGNLGLMIWIIEGFKL